MAYRRNRRLLLCLIYQLKLLKRFFLCSNKILKVKIKRKIFIIISFSLEYKYMKLIEWKDNAKESRLPHAESCGMKDDENEDDGEV